MTPYVLGSERLHEGLLQYNENQFLTYLSISNTFFTAEGISMSFRTIIGKQAHMVDMDYKNDSFDTISQLRIFNTNIMFKNDLPVNC